MELHKIIQNQKEIIKNLQDCLTADDNPSWFVAGALLEHALAYLEGNEIAQCFDIVYQTSRKIPEYDKLALRTEKFGLSSSGGGHWRLSYTKLKRVI